MPCHLYILHSPSKNKYYIGHTCDSLESRLAKHNQKHTGYTAQTNDWEIIYTEPFDTKELAYAREREIKNWKSRKRMLKLISGD